MNDERAVVSGRVTLEDGSKRTLWQLIKAGLVMADKPPSKHRTFTHAGCNRAKAKQRRRMAAASRRRNRPAKQRTGVRAKRV